jgi:hypothetical protein
MTDGEHQLFWREELVGIVTDVGWTDFPWAGGKITIGELSDEVRKVLEYIDCECKTEGGLQDWPFPEEYEENWRIIKPDGTEEEISFPIVDFALSFVTWR